MNNNNKNIIKIKEVISEYTEVGIEDINMTSQLTYDLGLTSFDLLCLMGSLEKEFNITIDDNMMKSIERVEDAYKVLLEINKQEA